MTAILPDLDWHNMKKSTTSFRVIGYEMETPDGNFLKSCGFWVVANTAAEAIKKAKSYKVGHPHFRIIEVVEKIDNDTP